jgi:hypothetical protein
VDGEVGDAFRVGGRREGFSSVFRGEKNWFIFILFFLQIFGVLFSFLHFFFFSQLRSPMATAILASTTARSATWCVRGRMHPRALPRARSKASILESARPTAAEVAVDPPPSLLEFRPPSPGDLERCCLRRLLLICCCLRWRGVAWEPP